MKTCVQCKKKTRRSVYLKEFPRDTYHWCSGKCLMIWIVVTKLSFNGEPVLEISNKKERISVSDLTPDDISSAQNTI